jgi:hypothetical protein
MSYCDDPHFLVVDGKWFVLIVDDYSRYLCQLCLGHRSINLLYCLSGLGSFFGHSLCLFMV